jgi:hypothetical protein
MGFNSPQRLRLRCGVLDIVLVASRDGDINVVDAMLVVAHGLEACG